MSAPWFRGLARKVDLEVFFGYCPTSAEQGKAGFGLAFELPVVVLALVRLGLITYEFMARTRPYAVVLIFVLAVLITPTPDVLTMMAMGLPMYLLYESCIWIAWFMQRRRKRLA